MKRHLSSRMSNISPRSALGSLIYLVTASLCAFTASVSHSAPEAESGSKEAPTQAASEAVAAPSEESPSQQSAAEPTSDSKATDAASPQQASQASQDKAEGSAPATETSTQTSEKSTPKRLFINRKRVSKAKTSKGKQSKKKRRKRRRRAFPKNRPKREIKAPPALGKIPFRLGEELTYKVNMINAHSGTVVLKVGRRGSYEGTPSLELSGFIRSSPFLENFYPIRDSLRTVVDERTFVPLKGEFYLNEKGNKVDYISDFKGPQKQIKWQKKRTVKGKERHTKLTYNAPKSIYNVLSSLYALRRLPLAIGLSFEQYVWDGQRERLITAEVVGLEEVITEVGRFEAFKIKIKGMLTGGIISRRALKRPPQEGTIWIANDAYRTPLRAITPTKLGQAEAILSARAVKPE